MDFENLGILKEWTGFKRNRVSVFEEYLKAISPLRVNRGRWTTRRLVITSDLGHAPTADWHDLPQLYLPPIFRKLPC